MVRELSRDKPSWLGEDENLTIDEPLIDVESDSWILRGHVMRGYGLDGDYRSAEARIDGKAVFHTTRNRNHSGLYSIVADAVEELLFKLAPPDLPEGLMQLAMAQWGDEEAAAVLVDHLIEQGSIKTWRRGIGRRSDTRTDDEKAAAEREDLRKKAKAWAKPHVELAFRRNWSTVPWAVPPIPVILRELWPSGVTAADDNYATITIGRRRR
jgi:hypothetical protein